ncbi:hypothetical protein [Mycolicibacterium nivoides]|uniref:hypothetical protein n=1 Tax=Mycolicibacterium nivoides TaxID=2487344 RepID=UPI000F5B9AFA|nr:hypothetical protein [Mycolicibacterium nivoides]
MSIESPSFIQALQEAIRRDTSVPALREADDALRRYREALNDWQRTPGVWRQAEYMQHERKYDQLAADLNRLELNWSSALTRQKLYVPFYRRVSPTQLIVGGIVAAVVLTLFVLFIVQLATNPLR